MEWEKSQNNNNQGGRIMKGMEIKEIELGKLVPNNYNPRKRMTKKYLESLKESLKDDGQLQTLLVRPRGDQYEIVAGMRRYHCLDDLYNKDYKVICSVQEMDDKTAMLKSFRENVEREQLNPIDEAGWFFVMLDLKEEQLFTPLKGTSSGEEVMPLPSHEHVKMKGLSGELGLSAVTIESRLPLLALPEDLQNLLAKTFFKELTGDEIAMGIEKGESIARLRLIGDKDESQEQMKTIWSKWGKEDLSTINEYVTKTLEAHKESEEILEKELKTLEKSLDKRIGDMTTWIDKDISTWFKQDSDVSIFKELPEELIKSDEGIEIPTIRNRNKDENYRSYADGVYNDMDGFVMELTRNTLLDDLNDDLEVKRDHLAIGKKELEKESCVYCGSRVTEEAIQKHIEEILDSIHDAQNKVKNKDKIRNKAEKMRRELGTYIKKFDEVASSYIASLDKLLKVNKIKEEDYQERVDKYKLG